MEKSGDGVWTTSTDGDRKGQFYTFQVETEAGVSKEVPDPYAKAVGVNGLRGMVVDLAQTNPAGWDADRSPALPHPTDAILYEMHVRDFTIAANSGVRRKGKFAGVAETGTKNREGLTTGIDHLKELGVTHVHLLPVFDYYSVNETVQNNAQYNWGYDPLNYNTPEGSYSSDAYDGATRIREFKSLIQALHAAGIGVVMDVVYNHTMLGENSNFNQLVPDYYYRHRADGKFSNGASCGNETASEQPMMRKFLVESVLFWAQEYHIDGFRFDLMGLHDIETMNAISTALHFSKPDIILYGEGWTAGDTPLPEAQRSTKAHIGQIPGVAAFGDDLRDAVKGSVFDAKDRGFVSGKAGMEESVKFGIVAATQHPQVDYSKVNYSKAPWAAQPTQCVNYVSCHDNHTLWDRLHNSNPQDAVATRVRMHRLAETIVLTSQGIPFLLSGTEMLRSKNGVENSYNSPDAVNQIDWSRKTNFRSVNRYFKELIHLRKKHPAFRMSEAEQIRQHLQFLPVSGGGLVAFMISDHANGDAWKKIVVAYNANRTPVNIDLPQGGWKLISDGNRIDQKGIKPVGGVQFAVPALSAVILAE